MIICICKNVSNSQIKACVKNGAENLHQVRQQLDLGTQCCKCLPDARLVIEQELKSQEKTQGAALPQAFGLFNPVSS